MRAIIILLALIAVAHAEALPKKKVGTCPAGYSQPGGFCARMRPDAPRCHPEGSRALSERVDAERKLSHGDATALARAIHKSRLSR